MSLQLPRAIPGFLLTVSCLFFPPGSSHSCGSVILFRPKYSLLNSCTDLEGRFVLAEFQDRDVIFRVVCVYAPNWNPERDTFFSFVSSKVYPSVATLVCGDFNAVFDRSMDRRGSNALDYSRESSPYFLPFFVTVVWLTFGDLFILLHLLSLGLGQMAHCPPGLTLSGVPIHGYISCGLVTCWLALIPTIVLFFFLFLFRNRLLTALAAGSSTPQSLRMLVSDLQSRISGLGRKI